VYGPNSRSQQPNLYLADLTVYYKDRMHEHYKVAWQTLARHGVSCEFEHHALITAQNISIASKCFYLSTVLSPDHRVNGVTYDRSPIQTLVALLAAWCARLTKPPELSH
jgi:hypothetical protein